MDGSIQQLCACKHCTPPFPAAQFTVYFSGFETLVKDDVEHLGAGR